MSTHSPDFKLFVACLRRERESKERERKEREKIIFTSRKRIKRKKGEQKEQREKK